MKRFILGMLAGVALIALIAGGLLFSISRSVRDTPPPTSTASPAASLAAGDTELGRVHLSSDSVMTSDGDLRDVTASGSQIRLSDNGLRAGQLTIDATLPFATAATQVGAGVELYAAGSGKAGVRRTLTFLGRDLRVTATGAVRADQGQLVIEPETVDLGGPEWLDSAASAAARQLVTIRHTVEGLPAGMRLMTVSVRDDGFRARLEGTDVAITR